jgi:3-oxoacid CoA-transferase subunit B
LGCVKKVVTELGVFDITSYGFVLLERAPGVSVDYIKTKTEGRLVANENTPEMELN